MARTLYLCPISTPSLALFLQLLLWVSVFDFVICSILSLLLRVALLLSLTPSTALYLLSYLLNPAPEWNNCPPAMGTKRHVSAPSLPILS